VVIGGEVLGTGTGSAKKHAEQAAAAEAYQAIVARRRAIVAQDAAQDAARA